jgi:hypothetical protein
MVPSPDIPARLMNKAKQEWVLLLLKVRFHVEFLDFRVWA